MRDISTNLGDASSAGSRLMRSCSNKFISLVRNRMWLCLTLDKSLVECLFIEILLRFQRGDVTSQTHVLLTRYQDPTTPVGYRTLLPNFDLTLLVNGMQHSLKLREARRSMLRASHPERAAPNTGFEPAHLFQTITTPNTRECLLYEKNLNSPMEIPMRAVNPASMVGERVKELAFSFSLSERSCQARQRANMASSSLPCCGDAPPAPRAGLGSLSLSRTQLENTRAPRGTFRCE